MEKVHTTIGIGEIVMFLFLATFAPWKKSQLRAMATFCSVHLDKRDLARVLWCRSSNIEVGHNVLIDIIGLTELLCERVNGR